MTEKTKNISSQFQKVMSGMLIFCLLLSTAQNAAASAVASDLPVLPSSLNFAKESLFTLSLPESVGKVKKIHQGTRPEFIIHIQDAHANEEAQKNISNIIDFFHQKYGLDQINVEGASGDLNTKLFTFFPDVAAKKEVSDYFLKLGRLSGAEYSVMTRNPKIELAGIEGAELYQTNRKYYLEVQKNKARNLIIVDAVEALMKKAERFVFTEEVRELHRHREVFQRESAQLLQYTQYLVEKAEAHSLDLTHYPKIRALLELHELEKTIEENKRKKIDISDALKRYQALYAAISVDLFDEIQKLENAVKRPLLKSDEAKRLDRVFEVIAVMRKMVKLTLSEYEVSDFYAHRPEFYSANIKTILTPIFKKYHFQESLPSNLEDLDSELPMVEKFYETALKRDQVLIHTAVANINAAKKSVSAIVTGGFHTAGIEKYLAENGYSYIIVTPAISKIVNFQADEALYDAAMQGRPLSLEKSLKEIFRASQSVKDSRFQLAAALLMNIQKGLPASELSRHPNALILWRALAAASLRRARGNTAAVINRMTIFSKADQAAMTELLNQTANSSAVQPYVRSEARGPGKNWWSQTLYAAGFWMTMFLQTVGPLVADEIEKGTNNGPNAAPAVLNEVPPENEIQEEIDLHYEQGALKLAELQALSPEARIRFLSHMPLDRLIDLFHADERSRKLKEAIPVKVEPDMHLAATAYPMSDEMIAYVTDYMKVHGLPTDNPNSLYPRDFYYKVLRPITIASGSNTDPMAKIKYDVKALRNDVESWQEFKAKYPGRDLERLTSSFLRLGFDDYLTQKEWKAVDANWKYRTETGVPFKIYLAFMILTRGRNFITDNYEHPHTTFNKRIRGIIGPYTRESVADRYLLMMTPHDQAQKLVENGLSEPYQNWMRNYIDGGMPHLFPESLYVGGEQKNERVGNTINQVAEIWRKHFGVYGISFPIAGYHENSDERREFRNALEGGAFVRNTNTFNNDILYYDQRATAEKYMGKGTDEQIALRIMQFILQHPVLWKKGAKNLNDVFDLKLIEEIVVHMKAHYQDKSVLELRRPDIGDWMMDELMGKFLRSRRLLMVNPNYGHPGAAVNMTYIPIHQPAFLDGEEPIKRMLTEVQSHYEYLPYDYQMLLWAPRLRVESLFERGPFQVPTLEKKIKSKQDQISMMKADLKKLGGTVPDLDSWYINSKNDIEYGKGHYVYLRSAGKQARYEAEQSLYKTWQAEKAKYLNYKERLGIVRNLPHEQAELLRLQKNLQELQKLETQEDALRKESKQLWEERSRLTKKESSGGLYTLTFQETQQLERIKKRLNIIDEFMQKLRKLRNGDETDRDVLFERQMVDQWDVTQRELEFYAWVGELMKDSFTNWHLAEYLTARKLGWDTEKSVKLAKMKLALRPGLEYLYGRQLKVEGDFYYDDPGVLEAVAEEMVERGLDPEKDAVLVEALFAIAHYQKKWPSAENKRGQYGVVEYEALQVHNLLVEEANKIKIFNLRNPEHYSFLIWWSLNRHSDEDFSSWKAVIEQHPLKEIAEIAGQKREALFKALNKHLIKSKQLAAREIPSDYSQMTPAERGEVMGFLEESIVDWNQALKTHDLMTILFKDYAEHPEKLIDAMEKATNYNESLYGPGWKYTKAKGGLTAKAIVEDPKAKAYFFDYLLEYVIKQSPAVEKSRSEIRQPAALQAAVRGVEEIRFDLEKQNIFKLIDDGKRAASALDLSFAEMLSRYGTHPDVLKSLGLREFDAAYSADQRGIFVQYDAKIHDQNYFNHLLINRPSNSIPVIVFITKMEEMKRINSFKLKGSLQISTWDLAAYIREKRIPLGMVLQVIRDKAQGADYESAAQGIEVEAVKLSEYVVLGLQKQLLPEIRFRMISQFLQAIIQTAKSEARIAQSA